VDSHRRNGHFSIYFSKNQRELKKKRKNDPYSEEMVYIMWIPIEERVISPSIFQKTRGNSRISGEMTLIRMRWFT
jgi:hypothetical protein